MIVLGLIFGLSGGTGPGSAPTTASAPPSALPALTPTAPPSNPAAAASCTKLLQTLPERLGDLLPRVVHPRPDSLFVVAWGEPAVIVRCGVPRPADLKPGSADFVPVVNGVSFLEHDTSDAHVYVAIDRAAYVEISFPKSSGSGELPLLATAIAKAMPPVCLPQAGVGEKQPDPADLCVNRP
ncbi:DUF3515 domain-containing protein [Jatrophihabitans cynanchi]|uniref:DUF3515 domain-containing protein n=1 Tax=Jatrophihabitans cynanchi TaxID=2944128 RepID=A0ABY7JZ37_9ACTN|nr:DUF3515 domain-containing protein [Jatrophihabitans sp. SB3-54]WAX57822.1 DUF3515 domain-containing protein [Jatrophihabitans sp. SB3-54]